MGFDFFIPDSTFDVFFFFGDFGGAAAAAAFLVAAAGMVGLGAEAAADLAAASRALEPRSKPYAIDIARVWKLKDFHRVQWKMEIQSDERESRRLFYFLNFIFLNILAN